MLNQAPFRLKVCGWWSCFPAQRNLPLKLVLRAQKKKTDSGIGSSEGLLVSGVMAGVGLLVTRLGVSWLIS